ncbi:MAG TPA: DUF3105 domain-containing protein [Thermomicrobiales bacterium]|nr:DUF3105 domain-containing protein [Thermomicrobiales bacterium]
MKTLVPAKGRERAGRATNPFVWRWLVAATFGLLGGGELLLGLALSLDRISLRHWAVASPIPALAPLVYRAYAAVEARGAHMLEAVLAGLGLALLATALLLLWPRWPRRYVVTSLLAQALLASTLVGLALASGARADGVIAFPPQSRAHRMGPIVSPRIPPPGGVHSPEWQTCGVYNEPIPTENAVHSLEHGAVWITYRPDLAPAQVQRLREITWQGDARLLSPYPDLLSPIVVTAWRYQLLLDRADDPRLAQFLRRYENHGPEQGVSCADGEGDPLPAPGP